MVAWAGLLVTVSGFTMALAQIRKARSASEAARDAALAAARRIRAKETLLDAMNAVVVLERARSFVDTQNLDGVDYCMRQVRVAVGHLRAYSRERGDVTISLDICLSRIDAILRQIAASSHDQVIADWPKMKVELNAIAREVTDVVSRLRLREERENDAVS